MSPSPSRTPDGTPDRGPGRAQVRAVMEASRVFVALIAESVAEVDDHVTPTQLRILVLVERTPRTNLTAIAEALDVHPSNATRAVDRLVRAGLLVRTESERDRRNLELSLTDEGDALLHRVMEHRRRAFERVLRQMAPAERASLQEALSAFARAAGEPEESRWAP